MKALAIVAIIILASLSATAYSSSGRSITVQTDSSYYHIGHALFISGRATYNDYPVQNLDVAISLKLSTGTDVYYPTGNLTTDEDGQYNATFTFPSIAKLGTYIVLVTVTIADITCSNQTTVQLTDTIYVKASGEIDAPANAPISRNGDVYNLTGSITGNSADGIVIESSSIILDGGGFALNGKNLPNSNGIKMTSVDNVTVRNIQVGFFGNGISENLCDSCHIVETNLSSDGYGIHYQQSNFNTIEGNSITTNTYGGILLDAGSDNNTISKNRLENTISSNDIGAINLRGLSNNNGIFDNNFLNNTWYAMYIEGSYSNSIFHNNFVNNTIQAYVAESTSGNSWDDGYPSGGNYWSNFLTRYPNAAEIDASEIWNTTYTIDANNRDNYPLMNSWNTTETSIAVNGTEYPVTITTTNSTITEIDATPSTLNFTVTGTPGTKGSMLIIVQKGLNTTQLQVFINGTELTTPPPTISDNGTHYFIYCELTFSTLQITVHFVVPVVPGGTLTATILMISALGVYAKLRRKKITA